MKSNRHPLCGWLVIAAGAAILGIAPILIAQTLAFRNAPASAAALKNPYPGNAGAEAAGRKLYAQKCTQCHGNNRQGMGPAPALDTPRVVNARPGELFWFITTGKLENGMPSWGNLSKQERWQLVSFLQSHNNSKKSP